MAVTMKTLPAFLIGLAMAGSAFAGFETWTNKDGKSVQLDLIKVTGEPGALQGEFKMSNGRTAILKAADLSEADAKRLAEWKPAETTVAAEAAPSAFDELLEGNLVALKGKSLASHRDFKKPSKYYLFYYTASWCGPCQAFTPSLVKFYNDNKPGNDDFEIILVTSDSDEDSMEGYAKEKQMIWPHLKLSKAPKFKKEVKHPGTGIPNLVLTDTEGNLLKTSYVDGKYVGPTVVMNHLGSLLKK